MQARFELMTIDLRISSMKLLNDVYHRELQEIGYSQAERI